ncbi:nuclear transport factor 2 family protein [Flagellimonas sp. 389]|uniref:nuclear transport factor 2 family protein n=1 Tax=Flagellimonas sp. 389 TaxID=2835862 RepID=UPI001BD67B2D|nr:nuclear transport factor 2 family protein [Flagellimonas sp. 389]MBS9464028.1 nuclear transport factor 2 family protein [Flagellimonas sp. 389]
METVTELTKETKADEVQSFNEYKEVEKALQPYIESARTGDGKLSRSAFFDHAHILGSVGGTLYNQTADEFEAVVNEGGPSAEVQSCIAWIDISGPAAAAKVEFIDWAGLRFTDFFVLYKENGKWRISGKVYDSHANN